MDIFWQDLLPILVINFCVTLGVVSLLWLISIPLRDVSIIDMFTPGLLVAIALVSYWFADGAETRKLLVVMLVVIWAARLTIHLIKRNWGHGEDPRYTKLRAWVRGDKAFVWLSLRKVFILQGLVIWFVSLPVQVSQVYKEPSVFGIAAWMGVGLWCVGFLFESIADQQLKKFRADPEKKGSVLCSGLWRYSRHPNYFGELCVWWGLFMIACDSLAGIPTIIGPILYTYLIINVTGVRTLEKKLIKELPDYKQYMQTTSSLIPMLPAQKIVE
ncbi:MAG: hypothetical protein CMO98_07285 [Woeseia sp.]|nr:hypothetical protein [Woeseia sp.]